MHINPCTTLKCPKHKIPFYIKYNDENQRCH